MDNIERNSAIVAAFEDAVTKWAPVEVKKLSESIEKQIINYFNPETINFTPPNSDYLMSSLLAAASTTVFYIMSVFILSLVVKTIAPEPTVPLPKSNKSLVKKFLHEPVQLVAMVYNIVQVIACGYIAYRSRIKRKLTYDING